MTAACEITVECAFGYGPSESVPGGGWTDITDDVDLEALGTAMTASSGRTGELAELTPGALAFTLDNKDDRYNPRNAAGPHYDNLRPGVPIRVTTTYDGGAVEGRWRGTVDGWPQEVAEFLPVVDVRARDALGLVADADAPGSAFDAYVRELPELAEPGLTLSLRAWYRSGPDGWVDGVGGRSGRHTGGMVALDPIVNGDPETWGQEEGDGYGTLPSPFATWPTSLFVSLAFRVDPLTVSAGGSLVLLEDTGGRLKVEISADKLTVTSAEPSQGLRIEWDARLADGQSHTIQVDWSPASIVGGITVDGRVLADGAPTVLPGSSALPGELVIGRGAGGAANYLGAIDHVIVGELSASPGQATVDVLAGMHDVALRAWAGQSLDARLASILDGMGVPYGALDTSGILTQHSYRSRQPSDLLQKIEDTEQGRIWVDRDGLMRFSKREWAWSDPKATTVQVVFSDDPDLLDAGTAVEMLSDVLITDDERNATTVAQVTSEFGRMQTALADPSIIERIGRRNAAHLSGLMHSSDAESLAIAQWLILALSEPRPRVERVSFRVESDPETLAPLAQTIEEGWLVKVRKMPAPYSSADPVEVLGHVIGIHHAWSADSWVVTLTLDGSRTGREWFTWGSSKWGNTDGEGWAF